jgi:hypothetical protein
VRAQLLRGRRLSAKDKFMSAAIIALIAPAPQVEDVGDARGKDWRVCVEKRCDFTKRSAKSSFGGVPERRP